MPANRHELEARFRPLRPASRTRLILASILGPLAWVLAVLLAALLVQATFQIELGGLVTAVSLTVAAAVLVLLRRGREKEERDYVDSA